MLFRLYCRHVICQFYLLMKFTPTTAVILISLVTFFACAPAVSAQESQEGRRINLAICCLAYANDVRTLMIKSSPKAEPAEMTLYQNGFPTPEPALVEEGRIVIYKKAPDSPTGWLPDWSIPVDSAGGSSRYVILMPKSGKDNNTNGSPYRPYILPPVSDFAYGTLMVLNFTPLNAGLEIGSKKSAIASGGKLQIPLKPEADSYNQVDVAASFQVQSEWKEFHTTKWTYNERIRQLSVIWVPEGREMPEITSIKEIKPWNDVPLK